MKKTIQNLLLFFLAAVIALTLVEVVIRTTIPQNLSGFWRVKTDNGLLVNKSSGSAKHQLGNRIVYYHFYEPHLRDSYTRNGTIQILVLGDSFTFGWLLDKKDTYVSLLQDYADHAFRPGMFNFLNAAAGGWGLADYLAYVEEFGTQINPALILLFLNTDDVGRSIKSGLYELTDSGALYAKRRKVPWSLEKRWLNSLPGYQLLLEHSHLMQLARTAYFTTTLRSGGNIAGQRLLATAQGASVPVPSSEEIGSSAIDPVVFAQAIFLKLKKWCDDRFITLLVTTTGRHDMKKSKTSREPTALFMKTASDFFRKTGILYGDISSLFCALNEDFRRSYSIEEDGHPSEKGSKFIADTVWRDFLYDQLKAYLAQHGKMKVSSELAPRYQP